MRRGHEGASSDPGWGMVRLVRTGSWDAQMLHVMTTGGGVLVGEDVVNEWRVTVGRPKVR